MPTLAQDYTWTGNNNNNWDNNGNWTGTSGFPDATTDSVLFDSSGKNRNVDLRGGDRDVASMTFFSLLGYDSYSFDSNTGGSGILRLNGDMDITALGDAVTFHTAGTGPGGSNGITLVQGAAGTWTNNGGILTIHSLFSGTGPVTMIGDATFTNDNNTYGGRFTIASGVTTLTQANAFSNTIVQFDQNNGLNLSGLSTANLGTLQGSGNIDLSGAVLTVGSKNANRAFHGNLTGTASQGAAFVFNGTEQYTMTGDIGGINSVSASNGLLRLSGNTTTLIGAGQLVLNGGDLSLINGANLGFNLTGGSGGVVQLNSRTLTITDSQLVTGRIVSSAGGVVSLDDPVSGPALVIGQTNLGSQSSTFAGQLTGTGTVQKVGTGTWTLTNASPFTGTTQIDNGSVILGQTDALQNSTVQLNVDNGLDLNGLDGRIGGLSGSGDLNLASRALTVGANDTDTAYSGALSSNLSGRLIKVGDGTLTLDNPSHTVGTLRASRGNLIIDGGNHMLTSQDTASLTAAVVVTGGTFSIENGANVAFDNGNGALASVGPGELNLTDSGTVLSGRRVNIGSTNQSQNAILNVSQNASLDIAQGVFIATDPEDGMLNIQSGGLVTANELLGGRRVGSRADINVTGSGSRLEVSQMRLGGADSSLRGGRANLRVESGGAVNVSGETRLFSDDVTLIIDGGTLSTDQFINFGSASPTVAIADPTVGTALTIGTNNGSSTFSSVISDAAGGPGSILKAGTGSLTLSAANTFSGDTIIENGSVILGTGNALLNSTVQLNIDNGLDVNGLVARLGALAGPGDLDIGGNILRVGFNNASTTYSGDLSGVVGSRVTKSGGGTWTVTGTLSGFDIVNVDSGGAVIVDGGSVDTSGSILSTIFGSATVRNGGSWSHANTTDMRGGSLLVESGSTFTAGATLRAKGGTGWEISVLDADLATTENLRLSYTSSDSGVFTASGASTTVTVGGRLDIGGSGVASTSTSTIENGATMSVAGETSLYEGTHSLIIDGGTFSTGTLNNYGNPTPVISISDPIGNSALTIGTNNGSSTFGGMIADAAGGPGSIRKVGTGTLTLSASNNFSGTTQIDNGSVILGHTFALGSSTVQLNINNGLDLNGLNATLGALAGSGDLNIGSNSLAVGGNDTSTIYSGDLTGIAGSRVEKYGVVGSWTVTGSLSGFDKIDVYSGTMIVDGGSVNTTGSIQSNIVGVGSAVVRNGGSWSHANTQNVIGGSLLVESGSTFTSGAALRGSGSNWEITVLDADLATTGNLRLSYVNASDSGVFTASGASTTVTVGGRLDIGGTGVASSSTTTIDTGATMSVAGETRLYDGNHSLIINQGTFSTGTLNNFSSPTPVISISDPIGNSAFTIGTNNGSSTFDGMIADAAGGPGSIRKVGTGTLTLTGANNYSGDTLVEDGTLSVAQPFLADTADVLLAATGTLDLSHNTTDLVDEFFLGGFSRAVGTHGAIGSGADFEWAQITGTGKLEVTSFSGLAGDYNADGVVDVADYTVWRDNEGAAAGTLVNDPNNGVIGTAQYNIWRANFGNTLPPAALQTAGVPEPSAILLCGLLAALLFGLKRR